MPSPVTIKIKVPPYIKKYIIAQSLNKQEPVVFERKHIYNISLIHKLSNYNNLDKLSVKEKDDVLDYFFNRWKTYESITIRLPYNNRKDIRSFNYLSINNKHKFLSEVKEDFYFELTRYLINRMRKKTQRKDAVLEFLERYNIIEDDISFMNIYRQSSRILKPIL